ncbi:MAG: hypothetical protein GYA17_10150 [Chloroflexi bacterium]|nr:hypothetical protein [Chloroflexota bacterium]
MSSDLFQQVSLSADEVALIFSLINQPELGKSILASTYGRLSHTTLEDKLTTASHSLLARRLAAITERGTVKLDESLEKMFYPIVKFDSMIQVTINDNPEEGPSITNVYLGRQGKFAAHQIELGVVHHLSTGKISDLPVLITGWLGLPESAAPDIEAELAAKPHTIPMRDFAELPEKSKKRGMAGLESLGFSPRLAELMVDASIRPARKGTVVRVEASSETIAKTDLNEGGAGLLYLIAEDSSWIFQFDHANDAAVGKIVAGTKLHLNAILTQLI